VALYVWQLDLEPDFPLAVIEYVVHDDRDRMHWHDHLEIAAVLEGRGVFLFGKRALPAELGDIFFINNSQPHVALADPGTSLRLLLVLFRPELIAGAGCRELDVGYLAPFRFDERAASPRIRGKSALAAEVLPALHELQAAWQRHDPAERHLVDATLRRALALVNRQRGPHSNAAAIRAAADRREQIRPVLAYVDGHCHETITLDDVAEVVHVSPSRVRHVFKDVTGVSFKEYLTQVRVAEAKRLLLGTDDSVAEVARLVSYTNLHQFYKVFHRSCAMSPGEYRRYYTTASGEAAPAAIRYPPAGAAARPATRPDATRARASRTTSRNARARSVKTPKSPRATALGSTRLLPTATA
jgi:AraC-like DNA-binding protein